jgi:hypothetical protein
MGLAQIERSESSQKSARCVERLCCSSLANAGHHYRRACLGIDSLEKPEMGALDCLSVEGDLGKVMLAERYSCKK